jgi:cytochrome c553
MLDIDHGRKAILGVKSSASRSRQCVPVSCCVLHLRSARFVSITPAIMKKIFALLTLVGVVNSAAAADVVGNPKAAENKVAMCIGCHGIPGYKATFPEVYQVPMLGGQSAKYLENALKAYQKGERNHPTMRGIAASLSDQDMADLAAYYAQQK